MRPKVYIETTVVSYLTALPSRDIVQAAHQQLTREWWDRRDRFELFVSQVVLAECGRGDAGAAARRLEILAGLPVLAATVRGGRTRRSPGHCVRHTTEGGCRRASHRGGRSQRYGLPGVVELHAHRQRVDAQVDFAGMPIRGAAARGDLHT